MGSSFSQAGPQGLLGAPVVRSPDPLYRRRELHHRHGRLRGHRELSHHRGNGNATCRRNSRFSNPRERRTLACSSFVPSCWRHNFCVSIQTYFLKTAFQRSLKKFMGRYAIQLPEVRCRWSVSWQFHGSCFRNDLRPFDFLYLLSFARCSLC